MIGVALIAFGIGMVYMIGIVWYLTRDDSKKR